MKTIFKQFFLVFFYSSSAVYAASLKQYPYVSGDILVQIQADRVLSSEKKDLPADNGFVYVQQNMALNFSKNWSAKTQLRLQPNNVLTTRDQNNPERYRTFLSNDRGFALDKTGVLLEELKLNYENDDVRVFAGKFDPTFGTAWRKTKRIGVFASQLTEDYNLREKIGAGVTALLENSSITFNSFVNDKTGLSRSMINDRGPADKDAGIAGNSNLSSYSFSMEGESFLSIKNLYYNFGYRSLGSSNAANRAREQGYVIGSEYLYKVGRNSSIIPFFEFVKINNFSGQRNRDAKYTTIALIGNYSSWTASASIINRNIKSAQDGNKFDGRQMQFSIGYKITDNITVDVSRANVKENGYNGAMFGGNLTYFYKF